MRRPPAAGRAELRVLKSQRHNRAGAPARAYPFVEAAWWRDSNTLVMLETEDIKQLELAARAAGVTCVHFVEPDWQPEGTLTALVLGDGKRLVRGAAAGVQLALEMVFRHFTTRNLPSSFVRSA